MQVIVCDIDRCEEQGSQEVPFFQLNEAGLSALKYLFAPKPWGVAPGWDEAGPLALSFQQKGCCP